MDEKKPLSAHDIKLLKMTSVPYWMALEAYSFNLESAEDGTFKMTSLSLVSRKIYDANAIEKDED